MTGRRNHPKRDAWRIQAVPTPSTTVEHRGEGFDELVVGKWFHLERMDTGWWWMRFGDCQVSIAVRPNGEARVTPWGDGVEPLRKALGEHDAKRGAAP